MFNNLTSRTTFYDLTGYLIPGLMTLAVGWTTCYVFGGSEVLDVTTIFLGKIGGVVTTLSLLAVGYVLGHFMNALSSLVYEKFLLKPFFLKAKDWQRRLPFDGKAREEIILSRAKDIYGFNAGDLQSFDLRIRAEEKMTQSFVTGFCFLSFYGMNRTLSLIAVIAIPLMAKLGWNLCGFQCQCICCNKYLISFLFVLLESFIALIFTYQYLRFVKYYYDYLGSTLLFIADGETALNRKSNDEENVTI